MVAEFDRVRTNGCEDNIFVWKPEKVLKFYKFSNDDLHKHKYL